MIVICAEIVRRRSPAAGRAHMAVTAPIAESGRRNGMLPTEATEMRRRSGGKAPRDNFLLSEQLPPVHNPSSHNWQPACTRISSFTRSKGCLEGGVKVHLPIAARRVYAHRTLSGHCHHRGAGRAAFTWLEPGQKQSPRHPMLEQPQANEPVLDDVCGRQRGQDSAEQSPGSWRPGKLG